MDQLEFALVPIGIVLGYGVTKILGAWAEVIHNWSNIEKTPILFLSSTAICLVFMYMNFSGLWAYGRVDFVLVMGIFNVVYLFAITLPMLLFMLAVSVLVPRTFSASVDLEARYIQSSRSFYLILALGVVASMLPDYLPGVDFRPRPTPILIVIAMLIFLALVRNTTAHMTVHVMLWSLLLVTSVYNLFSSNGA